MLQPMPKNSPKMALLDTSLPVETSPESKRFVSLAIGYGSVQFPFRFTKMILTPYRSCKPIGPCTHSMLTVVFMSGVRSPQSFSSHAKIPGYQQYATVTLCNSPGTLLVAPKGSSNRSLSFSDPTTTASKWLKLQLPAPVRSIR